MHEYIQNKRFNEQIREFLMETHFPKSFWYVEKYRRGESNVQGWDKWFVWF